MTPRIIVIAVLTFLVFTGCSTSVILNKKYETTTVDASSSMSVYMDSTWKLDYTGSMKDEFGVENPKLAAFSYLFKGLVENVAKVTPIKNVWLDTSCHRQALQDTVINGFYDTLRLKIPKESMTASDAEYSLIASNMSVVSKPSVRVLMVGLVPVVVAPLKYISISTDYTIWSNRNKEYVAYGHANGYAEGENVAVTIGTWRAALYSLAVNIFKEFPVRRKK